MQLSTHHRPRWTSVCALAVAALAVHVPNASAIDTFEPNNTRHTATPIVSGSPRVSYFSAPLDFDYYRFTLSSPQHIRIDLAVPDTMHCLLVLFPSDSIFELDWMETPGVGVDLRFEYTLPAGVYHILVRGSIADEVNSYTLSLTAPISGDNFEPNNRDGDATALPLGTTVSSFLFTRNDEDWYRIDTTAEGHLVVTLDVPESVDYELTLVNSGGSYVGSYPRIGDGLDEQVVATVPAGTYFAVVKGYHDEFWDVDQLPGEYSQTEQYLSDGDLGYFHRLVRAEQHKSVSTSSRAWRPGSPRRMALETTTGIGSTCPQPGTSASGWRIPPSADLQLDLLNGSGNLIARSMTWGHGADESIVRTLTGPGAV